MSPTIVHCAVADPDFETVCEVDDLTKYENLVDSKVYNLLKYYKDNKAAYGGDIQKIEGNTYHETLCINTMLYYTRPPLYQLPYPQDCKYDGKSLQSVIDDFDDMAFYCESFTSVGFLDPSLLNTIYLVAKTIQCFSCIEDQYGIRTRQQLRYWTEYGIYVIDCIPLLAPGQAVDQCDVDLVKPTVSCQPNEYLKEIDPKDPTKKICTECTQDFGRDCATCDKTGCKLCRQGFFYNYNGYYNYVAPGSKELEIRSAECVFDNCPVGQCRDFELNKCTLAKPQMDNCIRCQNIDAVQQVCQICKNGYKPSQNGQTCELITSEIVNQKLFVASTNQLHIKQTCMAETTKFQTKPRNGDSDFADIDPEDITKPSPFLFHAWKAVQNLGESNKKVIATIYMGRGIHFFFSCTSKQESMFQEGNFTCLYNYCNKLKLQRYYSSNDNFDITIMPLECSLETAFSFSDQSEVNAFKAMCVDYALHGKPIIYVNNVNTYFNVSGRLTIKNLIFSGINALSVPSTPENIDLSILPQLLCLMPNEPNGILDPTFINGTKNVNTPLEVYLKKDKNITKFGFNCSFYKNSQRVPQRPPSKWNQNQACLLLNPKEGNKAQSFDNSFPGEFQSSKACQGEPYSSDYFDFDQNYYYNRRRTLFNIYSFAEHQSIRGETPELIIENSQFEYFLAQKYESLINIEAFTLNKVTYIEKTYEYEEKGVPKSGTQSTFYTYNGADRGVKLTINNSVFKHSRFCKGAIVYRPSFFIQNNEDFRTIINQTNLFMTKTLKNSSDSFIIIKGSSFINMNAYSQVKSLGWFMNAYVSFENDEIDYFYAPFFLNQGIVLNVEDFSGRIEVVDSTFDRNFHYIPSILYNGESKGDQQESTFVDFEQYELYFTICQNRKDMHFFGGSKIMTMLGGDSNQEIDKFFNDYERLSVIYISRNMDLTLIKGNKFTQNIGTFGGAITIDSPNWKSGNQPHVVLHSNTFEKNMAYFSGNAVYIRPTMVYQQMNNKGQICAGINIIANTFSNNIGLKAQNGGALSVYCALIDDPFHFSYDASSDYSESLVQKSSSVFNNSTFMTVTSRVDGQILGIQKSSLNIQGNQFLNNYSGRKGTAVYIVQMSRIRIIGNYFEGNAPIYAMAENIYSVYKKFFSGRAMSFTDPECSDEFSYLQICNNVNPDLLGQYGGLQWPQIQGAVYIESCKSKNCLNPNNTQEVLFGQNQFLQNLAGPVLSNQQALTASQIFINGGKNLTIQNCQFTENRGFLYYFDQLEQRKLTKYFPSGYFEYSHSPLINIQIALPNDAQNDINVTIIVRDCQFQKNKNMQVLGLSNTLQYQGSLINIMNQQNFQPAFKQLVTFIMQDTIIRDNKVIGANSALIYTSKVITKMSRNQFFNNGHYYQGTAKWVSLQTNKIKYATSQVFPFMDISHNDYQQNGCIWVSASLEFPYNSIHEFMNNTFSYLFTYQGAAFTFTGMDFQQVLLQGNKYSMLTAMRGPAIYWSGNKETATVKMDRENIDQIFAGTEGAISVSSTTYHQNNLMISNTSFTNVYAAQGSALLLKNIGKLLVDNCTFNQTLKQNNSSERMKQYKAGFKMTQYNSLNYFVDDAFLTHIFTQYQPKTGYIEMTGVYKDLQKENGDSTDPIVFQGKVLQNLTNPEFTYSVIQSSQFLNNNALQYAALYGFQSKIKVKNTRVAFNKITEYGIIAQEGLSPSEIIIENVQFLNNTASKRCSGFFIGESMATLTNVTFLGNKAFEAATVYIESDANFTCQNCTFQENFADDGSGIYIQNNVKNVQRVLNSQFINNRATTNVMNIQYSTIEISNTTFLDNIAQEVNHGVTLIGSNANIYNVSVNYQNKDFLNSTSSNVDTGFFNMNYRSSMTMSSCLMRNCRGSIGAVFTVTGGSTLFIDKNTTFINCSSLNGDIVHASSAKLIQISNAVFQDNKVMSDVYIGQSPSIIKDSKFINSQVTSINVESSSIQMIGNLFFDNKLGISEIRQSMTPESITQITNFRSQQGKALLCKCNQQSIIANNTFRGLSAEKGAAIFLTSNTPTNNPLFQLRSNVFDSNYALNGGAVYLENGNVIMKNNTFMFNRADSGGAVFLSCLDTALNNSLPQMIDGVSTSDQKFFEQQSDGLPKKCNVLVSSGNVFMNNTARDAGAIKWTKDRPVIDLNTTKFVKNKATVYGDDVGSFPKAVQLVFLSNRDYLNTFNQSADNVTLNSSSTASQNSSTNSQLKLLQSNSSSGANTSLSNISDPTEKVGYIPPLVSGNKLDFNVYILDQDGNIYKSDSKSKATLDSAGSLTPQTADGNKTQWSEVILLNNAVIAQEGVYQFRGVELRANPGSSPSLNLAFAGLQTFGNPMSFASAPVKINTTVRNCVLGEELTVDGRCVACQEGWYQFENPEKPVPCKKCPTDAECKGKMKVYPKPGNWRSSNTSEIFMTCPNDEVCLGGDADHPQGKCLAGYQGFLCGDCAPNYSKTKEFTCGMCPERIRNIVQTSFILVGMTGYISFLVRGTLQSASEKKSTTSVYMKILTNHMQILSAISNIDYQWPSEIQKFQKSQQSVTTASAQIFSFDCFLMGQDATDNGIIPVFFQKLIMYALQPVIFLLLCIVFWSTVAKIKKYSIEEYRGKLISTMIVILFLVHPDIAAIMFSSFNCLKVDDKYRMTQNIRSVCYQGEHLFYMSVVAFPSIGVWVLGIPLFAFIVLRRNKRVIDLMGKKQITKAEHNEIIQLKTKYGFLFSGYEARAYFWEIIIMYRKILIIASSVFLSAVSPESQVLVVIFIIIVNMFMQTHINPFTTPTLNKMENYSLQVAGVTIYTGMYYVTGKYYSYMKINGISWFFLICIVLPNFVFLIYWALSMRIEVLKIVYNISKTKNLKPWIFKILAFMSSEEFYEKYIKKDEEFEEQNKQIILDAEPEEPVKLEDVVLEVTAINQDESSAQILNDVIAKGDDQPQSSERKAHRRKGSSRRSRHYKVEDDQVNFGGFATSRSHKVHPDMSRGDEFDHVVVLHNKEGPGEDALMFTLNRPTKEEKRSARRRKQRKETEKELIQREVQVEVMMIDEASFSLGEIEIEPDEVQESPNQNKLQDETSARNQHIHQTQSKSQMKFENEEIKRDEKSRSPRAKHQPRNEKQHKSKRRHRDSHSKEHHHQEVETSPRIVESKHIERKERKERRYKESREKTTSNHQQDDKTRSHSRKKRKPE